ncbi:MAG: SbmA/BacA-like family transporter [Desulfobacterales bacterium]|nr:SbmA/BacA-like family transporter [Desulfobacterales bacterium]
MPRSGQSTCEKIRIPRQTWWSLLLNIKQFATSDRTGRRAAWIFILLITLLLGMNGLNVAGSYVGRDFMTAIEDRNRFEFLRMALVYIGVFAVTTIVSVIYTYTEEYLGLVWREWVTKQSIISYATQRVYYRLKKKGEVKNPDQRIADDIRVFSRTTLSFVLMLLNGTLTVIAFSGVLWSISPRLFLVAVLYASAGTLVSFLFGRPLVRLNYDQLDKEANLRASLIHLKENAESIALSRREGHLIRLSLKNLSDVAVNFRHIIGINRRLNFFTTGYNWMIQIIPALVVAPLFLDGKVQFGVITQSAIAFTQLSGAFSLIVTQFQSISSYTAVFARLALLKEAGERERQAECCSSRFSRDDGQIAFKELTLLSPRSGRLLIKDLSLEIPHGRRILVQAQDETAAPALLRATAGLWDVSGGHIARPTLEQILLLPEIPYLPPGTLRELLMRPLPEEECAIDRNMEGIPLSEERILETLRSLQIDSLLNRFGGLDKQHNWDNILPLDKQQLLLVARVLLSRPRFALLDRPGSTLRSEQVELVLLLLRRRAISYMTFESEEHEAHLRYYDILLSLEKGGAWTCRPVEGERTFESREPSLFAA